METSERTWMGQLWVWPVKGPFGSTASRSDSIVLEQDIFHTVSCCSTESGTPVVLKECLVM